MCYEATDKYIFEYFGGEKIDAKTKIMVKPMVDTRGGAPLREYQTNTIPGKLDG